MRKIGIIAVLSLLVTAFAAVPALAVTPSSVTTTGGLHFCTDAAAPTVEAVKTGDTAFLTTSGTVCGAGTTAEATLSATALVTVGCITPSGSNEPKGLQTFEETTVGSQTFNTRQGRGSFSFQTSPVGIPTGFEYPSANMTETLIGVTFTDITLNITSQTGTITATFPDIDP